MNAANGILQTALQGLQGLFKGTQSFITSGPELADANIEPTYNTLATGTNYFNTVLQPNNATNINIPDVEIRAALGYRDAFKQGDVVSALNAVYNNIQMSTFQNTNCSYDTVIYWAQKYLYANREITALNNKGSIFGSILPFLNPAVSKSLTSGFFGGLSTQVSLFLNNQANGGKSRTPDISLLGSLLASLGLPNQTFFGNYSDSIGTLTNSKYLQLDSTLPIFDVTQNYYGVPVPYSASTDNKISNNTRNITYDLSLNCTALMRRNLINVAYTQPAIASNMASDATVAHGLNLINDLPTFVQINNAVPALAGALSVSYLSPRVFQFVKYLCTIGNKIGANLRDIFPATAQDKDFIVVTTAERALASEAEIKSISDDAIIQSFAEEQGAAYASLFPPSIGAVNSTSSGNTGGSTTGARSPAQPLGGSSAPGSGKPAPTDDPVRNWIYSLGYRETGFSAASQTDSEAGNKSNLAAPFSRDRNNGLSGGNDNVYREYIRLGGGADDWRTQSWDQNLVQQARQNNADYGYYQLNQTQVDRAIKLGMDPDVAAALNNGKGQGNYTLEQQSQALSQYLSLAYPTAYQAMQSGNYNTANRLLNGPWPSLPGGRSHNPGLDPGANKYLK